MHALRSAFVMTTLGLLAGCSSSTTLETDGGGSIDALTLGADTMLYDAGPSSTWRSCAQTSDCELVHTGCCDTCGVPTLASVDGVNRMRETEHFMDVCPMPTPCPACVSAPNANLVATCASSTCQGRDLSSLPLSACATDADCRLRYASCCGCSGTPQEVVAIRTDSEVALEALLCDGGGCAADCLPMMPPGIALCDSTTGHCRVAPTR